MLISYFTKSIANNIIKIFIDYEIFNANVIDILKKKKSSIGSLIMSNHPSYIDPIILYLELSKSMHIIPVIGENMVVPFKRILKDIEYIVIPNFETGINNTKVRNLKNALKNIKKLLLNGENILIYPTGKLQRNPIEEIGNSWAVYEICKNLPDNIHKILVRVDNAWDTEFSLAKGKISLIQAFKNHFKYLIKNKFYRPKIDFFFFDITDEFNKFKDIKSVNSFLFKNFNKKNNLNIKNKLNADQEKESKFILIKIKEVVKEMGFSTKSFSVNTDLDIIGMDSLDRATMLSKINKMFDINVATVSQKVWQIILDILNSKKNNTLEVKSIIKNVKSINKKRFQCKSHMIEISDTLQQAFINISNENKNECIVVDNNAMMTFKDFKNRIHILSLVISRIYKNQKHIGLIFPASIWGVIAIFAVLFSKKIPVMINVVDHKNKISRLIRKLNIKSIISSYEFMENLNLDVGDIAYSKIDFLESIITLVNFEDIINLNVKKLTCDAKKTDTAIIFTTSGTTDKQKIVPLTHENILSNFKAIKQTDVFDEIIKAQIAFSFLPIWHVYGLMLGALFPILCGKPVLLYPKALNIKSINNILLGIGKACMIAIPSLLQKIVDEITVNKQKIDDKKSHLKKVKYGRIVSVISGSEKINSKLLKSLKNIFYNAKFIVGYGLTECSPAVSLGFCSEYDDHFVGRVLPNLKVKIRYDDINEFISVDSPGIILVSGESIFHGYMFKNKKIDFVVHDNDVYFVTGDVGYIDKNNNLFLLGRKDRVIKIGGEKVSLDALQEYLKNKLYSKGHLILIENNNKIIAVSDDASLSLEKINQLLKKNHYKIIVNEFFFQRNIPILGSGKIDLSSISNSYERKKI